MIEATGLWLNEGKEGVKYFSGSMGHLRVVIFKNTFKKEGSNEPDYKMYFDEQAKKTPKEVTQTPPLDDDIPF
jgi:hypothetical protein